VSPVKYGLGSYIPEDEILHSHCRENLISNILAGCSTARYSSQSVKTTKKRFLLQLPTLLNLSPTSHLNLC
jgi:hypothetical protein